jgi:hypothetical protein
MAKPSDRKLLALLVGLGLGWFLADKGWHRHLIYWMVIALLIAGMWG